MIFSIVRVKDHTRLTFTFQKKKKKNNNSNNKFFLLDSIQLFFKYFLDIISFKTMKL